MGVLIGHEIIQTRTWIDPNAVPTPDWNYKNTFPMTVFDAIRDNYKEDSITLRDTLDGLKKAVDSKQPIFPAKPPNYLMTFGGVAGAVGSIEISQSIPWDNDLQRKDKIPTEKAVGDLLYSLGLMDSGGDPVKIQWSSIIGRPNVYHTLGMNEDGFVVQKVITEAINETNAKMDDWDTDIEQIKGDLTLTNDRISSHTSNMNNPHHVSISQIGAVSTNTFELHLNDLNNPHQVSKTQLGLEKVNNTADIDKPISTAVQTVIDIINQTIEDMNTDLDDLRYITDGYYDISSGNLTLIYRDGSTLVIQIPLSGLINSLKYNPDTKELVLKKLSGIEEKISLSNLFIRYIGSVNPQITVEIDGDQTTGNQTIKAKISPNSIGNNLLEDLCVDERLLTNESVTTRVLKNQSVTHDKMADNSISTRNIKDGSVTLGKLDTSPTANRIIAVLGEGTNPIWSQINSEMIASDTVITRHIKDFSITHDKLAEDSVFSENIHDGAITEDKLSIYSVSNNKIKNQTISGDKLVDNVLLPGTPSINARPDASSYNKEIPDTRWVKDRLSSIEIQASNLVDKSVTGKALFTSVNPYRVLVVENGNTDPFWGRIKSDMMDDLSVHTRSLIDSSVTREKIADKSILEKHITNSAVQRLHIADNAVNSAKLWTSEKKDRILAAIQDNGTPVYTQLTRGMIANGAIGADNIADRSVSLSKLQTSSESSRLLGVSYKDTDPVWMQATNSMLSTRSVDGRVLFSSSTANRVLAVGEENDDPSWIQINGNMIKNNVIDRQHITQGAIRNEHLQEKIVESKHIADWTIKSNNIAPKAITGIELFTSPVGGQILGVDSPYETPKWMNITTDMIEDQSINGDKLFRPEYAYRVLGSTNPFAPPEYLKMTGDFITDNSIQWTKMEVNPVLYGTPILTERPPEDADNKMIPDTRWVRQTVSQMVENFDLLWAVVKTDMIEDRAITGDKLFTSPVAPRVLGVTHPGQDPEYILIEEDLIANGAVTKNKLARDITLMGSPHVEVRPAGNASTVYGGGTLIPDCQWVIDRIYDASTGGGYFGDSVPGIIARLNRLEDIIGVEDFPEYPGGDSGDGGGTGGGGSLTDGGVLTRHLQDRAVTGEKMFTSIDSNRILAVLDANTSPVYTRVNNDMVDDRIVDGRTLFSSPESNRILGVVGADSDPSWTKINFGMMGNLSVGADQLRDDSVGTDNIQDGAITHTKIAEVPVIDSQRIFDGAVTNDKYANKSITNDKIADGTIKGNKMEPEVILPKYVTVESNDNYLKKSLRNIIISPDAPSNDEGDNGDIWIRYRTEPVSGGDDPGGSTGDGAHIQWLIDNINEIRQIIGEKLFDNLPLEDNPDEGDG